MLVLLKAAWEGWQNYIDTGKYAALLLVVLLFLWFGNVKKQQRVLTIYTTLLVVCCVCPLSAVCLMLYQTRFYDYEWIWNYVPVTIMLAYGGVVFLAERWECYKREHKGSGKAHLWQHVGLCAMVAALIFLCGSMGRNVLANGEGEQYRTLSDAQSRANTQRILFEVIEGSHEYAEGQDICLWAPKDIMAAARAGQYNITLPYGRNMWDAALGAYSYETYTVTEESLYHWMQYAEKYGALDCILDDGQVLDGVSCMELAVSAGVNYILLPATMQPEALQTIEKTLGVTAQVLGEYYLLVL